jgi:hypothetical protein
VVVGSRANNNGLMQKFLKRLRRNSRCNT